VLTDSFERIGHSLFALLFASLGGMAATYFYRTRDKVTAG
jgi:hypothetical protein